MVIRRGVRSRLWGSRRRLMCMLCMGTTWSWGNPPGGGQGEISLGRLCDSYGSFGNIFLVCAKRRVWAAYMDITVEKIGVLIVYIPRKWEVSLPQLLGELVY